MSNPFKLISAPIFWKRCRIFFHLILIVQLTISLVTGFSTTVYANTPNPGGDTTVVNPTGEGAVSITEDSPQPEAANIRLIVPELIDPSGGNPSSIRIISVTGGTLYQADASSITLGSNGTILALSSSRLDLRFTPTPNRDTAASFQYAVVDPHNDNINSNISTASIPIAAVNDLPILQTSSGDSGDGLFATYFRTAWDLTGATTSRIDATINFNSSVTSGSDVTVWGVNNMNAEMFSVRWTGQVKAPVTGSYTFSTISDDGVRLWIDNALLIDNWTLHAPTTDTTATLNWDANSRHDIRMEFYERGGGEQAALQWQYTGQDTQVIPQQYFFPATVRPTLTYVTDSGSTSIDDGLMISDVDSTDMNSATITISNNYLSSEDSLAFTNQNGITGSYSNGVLSLSGSSSLTNYQDALRSVTYSNSNSSPNTSTRTITFVVNDGAGNSNTTSRDIAISSVNSPPVITQGTSTSVTMSEDANPAPFTLTLTASDPENNTITWSISSAASHGEASVSGTGNSKSISYTPVANYNGPDSFIVQISDGLDGIDTITVNVTVAPRNDPPYAIVAPSTSGIAHPGSILSINNGTWSDNIDLSPGTLSYAYQWQIANDSEGTGLSDITGATSANYTPGSAQTGKYVRTKITVSDNGEGTPASQSVVTYTTYSQITNSIPAFTEGNNLETTIDEDNNPESFNLTLHANDTDNDTLTWTVTTPATHGAAALSGSGNARSVVYEPDSNYNGTDSFVINVNDGLGGTANYSVSLIIRPRNDLPNNTSIPTITSLNTPARVDYTLTANPGTWNDNTDQTPGTLSYTYQWQQCSEYTCTLPVNIDGAVHPTYTIKPTDKNKYIRVKVTANDNGEGTPNSQSLFAYSSSIGQILPPDSKLIINQGQAYANNKNTNLNIDTHNILTGATQMILSEDPNFGDAQWQSFNSSTVFALSNNDGLKTIFIKFRDEAGNESSSITSTILLDTVANLTISTIDTRTLSSNNAIITTSNQQPSLTGIADPGATITITIHSDPITGTVQADNNGTWTWTPTVTIPYGTHEVVVVATDEAGNSSQTTLALVVDSPIATTSNNATSKNTSQIATSSQVATTPATTQTKNDPIPASSSAPQKEVINVPDQSASNAINQNSQQESDNRWTYWLGIILAFLSFIIWLLFGIKRKKKEEE